MFDYHPARLGSVIRGLISRPIVLTILVLMAGEIGVFYWENRDVVALNRSEDALVRDARFPDAAQSVLARRQVSRRVLERVADVARRRHDVELHVTALERIVAVAPHDAAARLRLAQALRAAGRLDEAQRISRQELQGASEGGER